MNSVKDQLRQHMLEGVDMEDYGLDNTLENAAKVLFKEVIKDNHSLRGSMPDKFWCALNGLHSFVSMPYYYKDIENLMYAIGHDDKDTAVEAYEKLCGEILAEAFKYECAPSPLY